MSSPSFIEIRKRSPCRFCMTTDSSPAPYPRGLPLFKGVSRSCAKSVKEKQRIRDSIKIHFFMMTIPFFGSFRFYFICIFMSEFFYPKKLKPA
ncbi:hypothetical protein ES705_33304 [subsurface metagenome]